MNTVQKALKEYEQRQQAAAQQSASGVPQSTIPGVQAALEQYYSRQAVDPERYQTITNTRNRVSSFIKDADSFLNAYSRDFSGGKRNFNAADYLAERQQQADELKRRRAELSGYLEDIRDSYSYADYLDLRDYLDAFDSDVDGIMAEYGIASNAKSGMRAYEEEWKAYQDRMAQQQKLAGSSFSMQDNPVYGFLNMHQYWDAGYVGVDDNWTEEEKFVLGQLQTEDPARAREYARQVNDYYSGKATEEDRKRLREAAAENMVLNTIGALGVSMVAGIPEFLDRLAEYSIRGTTTEKSVLTATDYASEVVGGISQDLNERYGTIDDGVFMLGGKGVGDLYNMGYSMAQNLLTRYTLGAVGGAPLMMASYFANAATAGIDEARRRGASGDQAMLLGVVKGALEVGTEYIPTSELFKMGPAVTVKDLLKSVGIEALDEFVGEGINAGLGYLADKKIMGNLSEFETAKRAYMEEQGLTEEEATKRATMDAIGGILFEGLSGAVSGAVSGGTEVGVRTGMANLGYRGVDAQAIIDSAMETDVNSDAYQMAQQMQKRLDDGETISGNQKRMLDWNTNLAQLAAEKVAAETAAADDLAALGQVENLEQLAAIVAKRSRGKKLSRSDRRAIRGNERVQTLFDAMDESMEDTGDTSNVVSAAEDTDDIMAMTNPVAEDGRARRISTNESVDVLDFASLEKGNGEIQLQDGSTADVNDIAWADENQARRFMTVKSLPGIETEAANDLIHTMTDMKTGGDIDTMKGVWDAYGLGYYGAEQSAINTAGRDSAKIPEGLRLAAYQAGQKQRAADAAARPTLAGKGTAPSEKYKKVVLEGKIQKKNLSEKQEGEVAFMDYIAENFSGTTVHVYQSYRGKDGKYYYRDSQGNRKPAPNGQYVGDEIWVDLNAGNKGEGLVLNTFAHEMYHHVEKWNKGKANELAQFVVRELGLDSVEAAVSAQMDKAEKAGLGVEHWMDEGLSREQAENTVYDHAMSDFVADSLETMFTRGDPAKAIANLKQENRGLFDEIKAFVDKWVSKLKGFYKDQSISMEGEMVAQLERFEELQKLFMEAVQGAGENYREAVETTGDITPGKEGVVVDKNGEPVAMSTDDGSVMLSIRTYEEEGRSLFRKYLDKCVTSKRLTKEEAKEMRDSLEEIYQVCKDFKDEFAPFSKWSDAEVIRDTHGRPVFSVVTPNGEYKMNLDFSLVCRKRRTLDAVFNEMTKRGIIDDFELGQKTVVKINEIIRKFQFETACSLCFVDARRFRQADVADSFVKLYNDLVQSLVPEDRQGEISRFNFGGVQGIDSGDGITGIPNDQLDFSHINDVLKRYESGTVEYKAAKYIKANAKGRKLLMRGDFMSSKGFDAVKSQNEDIMKLYNSKKGTGGPKAAFGDVQYLNEVIKKARWWTPKKAYEVGGVRIQSFSDYVPRMVFDYVQMIHDLAANKLPAHAYTKEALFVQQFGMTGVKINMSLIPAIADGGIAAGLDKNGNYVWAGESFDFETAKAIQNAAEYTENCGTICVGVSYDHIVKLLGDPNIRMVIPYHKSGLNPIVAHMNKIAEFTDYSTLKTNPGGCQSTMDSNGQKVEHDFNFNEDLRRTGDPKKTAQNYLAWCHDPKRNYTPKFAEFEWHENYYKLLIDFTVYDKDGNYVPQRGVRAVFPKDGNTFGSMKDLIRSGLEEDAEIEGRRNRDLPKIVDEILNVIPRTEAEIAETAVKQADRDLEADAKFSLRNAPDDMTIMEREFVRLAGKYEKLDSKAGMDEKKLAQLKADLRAEAGKHKEDSKLWDKEFNRLLKLYEANGRKVTKLEEKLRQQKASSKAALEAMKERQAKQMEASLREQRAIREELTGQKSNYAIMEREFIRIAKEFEKLESKAGKQGAKDAQIIRDLRAALNAEAKSHKSESEIWQREFARLLREYETSGRRISVLEQTIQRQRASAKAKVQSRRNTEMRHKIQRKVGELNRLLTSPTKHRNVPEYLQTAVADILDAINMEVRDGEQRRKTYEATLLRYDQRIAAETDPAKVSELIDKRNEYAAKGDQFASKMDKLKKAYEEIRKGNDSDIEIDTGLGEHLDALFEKVGDTPLGQMNAEQLAAVNDVLNITMATVRNANEMLAEERSKGIQESSQTIMREVRSIGGGPKKKLAVQKLIENFGWLNLKPVQAMEVIGSEALTKLYNNVRKGEDTLAVDLTEARDFFRNQWSKHKGESWDRDKQYTFTSTSGKKFQLTVDQIMSLYALSKRDQARDHLRVGGFSFDSRYTSKEDVKIGPLEFQIGMESTDASAYNLSDEILGEIIGKLSPEQRAFVDEMQGYLSDTMAAKGNEVSLKKYGIRLFKEKNYFPLRVADQYMAKKREQQSGDRKLNNAGFTQAVTPNAKNPVVLSSFMETWAEHVDEMSLYHSFVLPLDDLNRVLNYHDQFTEEGAAGSVVEAIRNAYGEGATKYLDQLIRDVNGGARADSVASILNKGMSMAKKAQTLASLSVAIQQPSAIMRAGAMIDPKYFIGPKVTGKMADSTWEEIKKYAPIARIKEMGGFDTNVGKSTVEYLTDTTNYEGFWEKFGAAFTDSKYRDELLGRLPAKMDELSWGVIWNAVKREQEAAHPAMNPRSDAFMKIVAERFTDVISRTQVYDSVFSRSGMMRSKDTGVKMATSFMAEPTTTANMLAVALVKAKRGGKESRAQLVRTVGALTAALIANSALVAIVYAMRDDDDEKRYGEKWLESFREQFIEGLDPRTYVPILRDFVSMSKGFDIERTDMALYGDFINALNGLKDQDRTVWEKIETLTGATGNLLGIPVKNMLRDGKGLFKTIRGFVEGQEAATGTGWYLAATGQNLSDGEQMLTAIRRGDEAHIQRVFGRFDSQKKAESALQSAIRAEYVAGKITAEEATQLLTENFDREDENEVYWMLREWDYAKENGSGYGYGKFDDLYKAIESGEGLTEEIQRYRENGTEDSTIKSQISKTYRQAYLADGADREAIADKVRPAYLALGYQDSGVDKILKDWDFEAEYGMSYADMKNEYREGTVDNRQIRGAMEFYGLKRYEIEATLRDLDKEIRFYDRYGMSLSEMLDAYDAGDVTRNSIIGALEFSGKTNKEARESITQRDIRNRLGIEYSELDNAYQNGDISYNTFRNAMLENGATQQEADEAIAGYDWLKNNARNDPELTISDAKKFAVSMGSNAEDSTLEDYGISVSTYKEYKVKKTECHGVDANGDGKTDSGTLRDSIFRMIDSMAISDEQKDALALLSYSMKSIRKYAPWH